jgi:glycosyltransferase involved in cell wall biosynthesis
MVENLQLNDRVRFTGFVSPEKLPELLGAADVFARPSLSEGMGNSFIEAMAVGLPVVGTAVGGITDFLRDKETGLVCAVGDPADIARKISILLRDNEIRQYVAKNARAMVESRYSWPKLVSGMKERVFKKILE